ncbi:DNA repair protein RecN [uncultured Paludibaculum sp.]|uniref:DNA repair protein RecN n=1 Tax=uncultured Paludibaculum sp. TaxID=1765020 RepID=UPI002AABAB3F|nr:DNA repair protein RecN [uncultured Paludibaculum sp.]
MLVELVVENFAVVERLRLPLHAGLNALTGETGSGKSLMVDALTLLLGGRASSEMVRTGAARAFVSGRFEVPSDPEFHRVLEAAGLEAEDGEILLAREILSSGKSRAFAASRPVAASFLKEIAPFLGDIHGQHDQQKLFSGDSQRDLLDESAAVAEPLAEVEASYHEWHAVVRALQELNRAEQEKLRMADLWTMQRKEIEALELTPGEEAQLENEKRVLKNVARLSEAATVAHDALSESEHAVASSLGLALKKIEELAKIDESLSGLLETLRPAQIAVKEAAMELGHYLGHLEADPKRLEDLENRLAQIEKLKRKYGTTIEEILAFYAQVCEQLDAVESAGERRAELEASIARRESEYKAKAERLRSLRTKAAKKLEKAVETELGGLAMKGTSFRIALSPCDPSPHGMDAVEFLVSANIGEELRPLDKVASGGELSRVALALKTCVVQRSNGHIARTLVFDEVDSGVGGAAAETIGRRLKKISESSQVLCVTHLAQIAGFADHHYVVSKRESGGRTSAQVDEMLGEERVREIGRMLSGQHLSAEALRHAEKLIEEYARRG